MRTKHQPVALHVQRAVDAANVLWPDRLSPRQIEQLRELLTQYDLSPSAGDLDLLDSKWYVTHSGLLRLARANRCSGIHTEPVPEYCDPTAARWVIKATVFKTPRSKGFVGYGDADPTNVSSLVRGAEMRIAETRAVNRALRKAYGIGLCSVEELGGNSRSNSLPRLPEREGANSNGEPRLRDRLLVLIRQYRLDTEQVKRYAIAFCGTTSLREASREQITKLVDHLSAVAGQGRERLLAELASSPAAQNASQSVAASEEMEAA